MKMAKKLLAVVLAGVMAVSMLTGCASISSRRVADELEGMLKAANDKATVKAVDDDLANKAVKVAKQDNKDALKEDAALKLPSRLSWPRTRSSATPISGLLTLQPRI